MVKDFPISLVLQMERVRSTRGAEDSQSGEGEAGRQQRRARRGVAHGARHGDEAA